MLVALDDQDDFPRISRQSGVFLAGGTPSTEIQRSIRRGSYRLGARDVRLTMSIPLALHSWMQAEAAMNGRNVRGRQPTVATALTLRVPSGRKARFREQLAADGYSYRHLFPDPRGLLDYSFMSE